MVNTWLLLKFLFIVYCATKTACLKFIFAPRKLSTDLWIIFCNGSGVSGVVEWVVGVSSNLIASLHSRHWIVYDPCRTPQRPPTLTLDPKIPQPPWTTLNIFECIYGRAQNSLQFRLIWGAVVVWRILTIASANRENCVKCFAFRELLRKQKPKVSWGKWGEQKRVTQALRENIYQIFPCC